MFEDYNTEPDYLTEDDPLTALLAQPTNEEKRKRKELEEEESNSKKLQRLFYENQALQNKNLKAQTQREDDLRVIQGLQPDAQGRMHDLKGRTEEKYAENIKSHYGFTPDSKKKKTLAGILEAVTGIAGTLVPGLALTGYGTNKVRGRKDASQEMKDEFNRLIGTERLESQNFKDQSTAMQRNISELQKGALGYGAQDIQKAKLEQDKALKTRQMNIQEKFKQQELDIKESLATYQNLQAEAKTGNIEAQTAAEKFKLDVAKRVGIDPKMISDANLPVLMAKIYKEQDSEDILKNVGAIADKKNESKAKFAPAPLPKMLTEQDITVDKDGNMTVKKVPYFVDVPRRGNPIANTNPGEALQNGIQQTVTGQTGQAKKPVLTGGQGTGGGFSREYKSEDYKNSSLEDISKDIKEKPAPLYRPPDITSGKKYADSVKKYKELYDRERDIAVQNLSAYAKGDLSKFAGPLQGSKLMQTLRGMTGKMSAEELEVEQKQIFQLGEHLKQRLGGGTRVAHDTMKWFADALHNSTDSPEGRVRRQLVTLMMLDTTNEVTSNPRFEAFINKAHELHAKDPNQLTVEEAINQEINSAIADAKKTGQWKLPTFQNALERAKRKKISATEFYKMGPQE